jgi:hypothetical protein
LRLPPQRKAQVSTAGWLRRLQHDFALAQLTAGWQYGKRLLQDGVLLSIPPGISQVSGL